MKEELKEIIEKRKERLDYARNALKEKFFGIDDVIDDVIEKITLWYLMPDVQISPLIISLWGITGVGKTDLVRTLVDILDFNNKFVEIQMDTRKGWKTNVEDYIEEIDANNNEPIILLLDEIQRYRTIDESGKMIKNDYYNDIWTLLSDGQFSTKHTRINELISRICEMYYIDDKLDDNDDNIAQKNKKYKRYYYDALSIKKLLKLKQSVNQIMEMTDDEIIVLLESELKQNKINCGVKYNQMLIFISGNIDEAYAFAEDVDDADRDADVFYDISKKINFLNIKDALTNKFKPEQISRFGNNHVIYPTICKKGYIEIINYKINEIINKIKELHEINIELSDEFIDIIYRNGVFPAQGVRPLISTINQICSEVFSFFIFKALCGNINDIKISIDSNEYAVCNINNIVEKKKINLQIDKIKNSKTDDEIAMVAVHELGHALVYSIINKIKPEKIEIKGSKYKGFMSQKNGGDNMSKIGYINMIASSLGGLCAEEIVFGLDYRLDGCSKDLEKATYLASMMVRKFGMDKFVSSIDKFEDGDPHPTKNYDIMQTNSIIENILLESKKNTKQLILNHIDLYKELVDFAVKNKSIPIEKYTEIFKKYGIVLCDNIPEYYNGKVYEFLQKDVTN